MFKLIKVNRHDYLFYSRELNKTRSGTIEHVSEYMNASMGISDDEIDKALVDMGIKGTNVSEFNQNGKFIGSLSVAVDKKPNETTN